MDSWGNRPRKPRSKYCYDDRLSPLPDDILHRILSFVDFLDVVRTCVLSRRWQFVWMSVPFLNFSLDWFSQHNSNKTLEARYKFWDFIKWALLLRDESRIRRICLSSDDTMINQLNGLLLVAARKKVLELSLNDGDYASKELEFPPALCETLTSLSVDFRDSISFRAASVFKSLKSLYLRGVIITGDIANKLFSSDCVRLEDVHLEGCKVIGVEHICISACNLKNLTIANGFGCGSFWVVTAFGSRLNISTPNLVSFTYIGPMLPGFELLNTVSLRQALIRIIRAPKRYEDEWGHKNQLLFSINFTGLSHAKSLTLSALIVKHFSPKYDNPMEVNFILDNLTCLKLGLRYNVECMEGMINLLKLSPNLEALVIRFKEIPWCSWSQRKIRRDIGRCWKTKVEDVACLTYHVKTVQISNYDGSEIALGMVKFLLKSGMVLENVQIMCKSTVRKRQSFSKLVALLPKASSKVIISFPEYSQIQLPWFDKGNSEPEDD